VALFAPSVLKAQNPTATLAGNVTDVSGAAVAAARFQMRNTQTNE
jgi:hypothetical protein